MLSLKEMEAALKKASEERLSEEDKLSRFEEGVPADPTVNMDPEDAAKWNKNKQKYKDKFKKKRARLTEYIPPEIWFQNKEASRTAQGLYGYTKGTQKTCEAAVKKMAKITKKIASALYKKDVRTAQFLQTHAKRGKSSTAKALIGALSESFPKFASHEKVAGSSLYGFEEKTVKLALDACAQVRMAAGKVASEMH
ncbi:MAG: hypothetical protein AAGM67_21780, partial [Bacteroidota bacterium]